MKNLLAILFIIAVFPGCSKTIDDTSQNCVSNCTTIRGRIFTKYDRPILNVDLALSYRKNTGTYSHSTRKIKNVRSDQNGYYEMIFNLQDDEVGAMRSGYFTINIDKMSFDRSTYLIPDYPLFSINTQIYSISKKDTIITKDYYMPSKALLKINLKGFTPITTGDVFKVVLLYPYGWRKDSRNDYLGSFFETGISGHLDEYSANSNDYTTMANVASNDTCVIQIRKIKNGVSFPEDVRIFVHDNSSPEYTFHY